MTKCEAYQNLKDYLDNVFHNSNDYETYCYLRDCADTLASPAPDPVNGLVPCGCGGKAKCLHHLTPDGDYAVKCGKCKIMTDWLNSPEDAIRAFNTAMGYKEQ